MVELVQQGHGVIFRKTFLLPSFVPQFTTPTAHQALVSPQGLRWHPLGLQALQGPVKKTLSVSGFTALGNGGGQGSPSLLLDDATGNATWMGASSRWTHIEMVAELQYPGDSVSFLLVHSLPVN